MSDVLPFPELDALLAAAGKLPVCDAAAKLHALVARVSEAAHNGGNVAPAAAALASAAAEALADDPWVRFEQAARAFLDRSAATPPVAAAALLNPAIPS